MTASLVYERTNNHNCAFPLEELKSTYGKSYYKFYQLKLQQLLSESRYRQENDEKHSRQKQIKTPLNEKRSSKVYMNHLREKLKTQSQNDDNGKRASSVIGSRNRRKKDSITCTITSSDFSTTNTVIPTDPRPKSTLKTKQSSFSTKRQRVASAPANSQRNLHKKPRIKIPTIEIDHVDDNLSKSNGYSYTEVSSSSQNYIDKNNQYARQSILNTIMLHLHLYTSSDISKWNLYRDFDDKMSASISPTVYRNFERIIL